MNAKNRGPVKKNNKNVNRYQRMPRCIGWLSFILQEIQGIYYIFTKSIAFKIILWVRGFVQTTLFLNSPAQKNQQVIDFNDLIFSNSPPILIQKPGMGFMPSIFCSAIQKNNLILRRIQLNCDLFSRVFISMRTQKLAQKGPFPVREDQIVGLKRSKTATCIQGPHYQHPWNQTVTNSIKVSKINELIQSDCVQLESMPHLSTINYGRLS
jgi:hypothetical protein